MHTSTHTKCHLKTSHIIALFVRRNFFPVNRVQSRDSFIWSPDLPCLRVNRQCAPAHEAQTCKLSHVRNGGMMSVNRFRQFIQPARSVGQPDPLLHILQQRREAKMSYCPLAPTGRRIEERACPGWILPWNPGYSPRDQSSVLIPTFYWCWWNKDWMKG